jgi:hypothetical protein
VLRPKKAEAESCVVAAAACSPDNVWLWNNILTLVTAGENYWALLFAQRAHKFSPTMWCNL